ncbi:MAG: dihydroorotase [Phycisphaerae bacterium]|nr:dihydroorotase [Phycisphaerae bacterium]
MKKTLLQNGRVIDPANGVDAVCDVLLAGGEIAKVGTTNKTDARGAEVIDAGGKIVCPGLIDPHVHCREPGYEDKETIATAAAAATAGGFATICCMPNTNPPLDNDSAVHYVLQQSGKANLARVLPVGCISKGRDGKELAEMGLMLEAGAVAFTDDGNGVGDSMVMQRALQYSSMLGVPLMQHCQEPSLFGGSMNSGPVAVRLGLGGIASAGEEIMLRRDLELIERIGAAYHVQHVSTAGSVEMLRQAKADGLNVSAEATPHHLLLTDAACMGYDPNYKVNPPLRTAGDVEAVRQGVADGTLCCLATDHAPHTREEKELEFALAPFGIIGLEVAVGLYAKALIEAGYCDWPTLIERMTTGPAKVIHSPLGTLTVGRAADVTVINPKKKWTVKVDQFHSKGRNCPYNGMKLKGRPVMTIVGGEVKFRL